MGFLAQEVEKVLPEVVNKGEDSYRSVEYGKIVAVAIAAIKEMYRELMGIKEEQKNQSVELASKANKNETDAALAEKDEKIKKLEEKNKELQFELAEFVELNAKLVTIAEKERKKHEKLLQKYNKLVKDKNET